jgi:phosphatidate cytidylyltransferase
MTSNTEAGVSAARTERATSRNAALPLRIASAVIFLPLLVLLARLGGIAWLLFTVLVVGLALREFYRMMESKGLTPHWKSGTFAVLLMPIAGYVRLRTDRVEEWHLGGFLTMLVGAVLLAELRRGAGKQAVANTASTLLGVLYIGWLGTHIGLLRELPGPWREPYARGMSYALLPFFLAWACDTVAYAVGLAFGRHKLVPDVSPHKSVEGAVAGFAASIGAAWVARAWFAPYLTATDAWALGALVGLFGQLGDLVESLLKRDAEAKDASRLIPGHGGVLDRFDSIFFAAPIVYYYLLVQVVSK